MKLLVVTFKTIEYCHSLVDRRFRNVYLLESAYKRLLFGNVSVVFLVCGRANEAYGTTLEIRLEHIRSIESRVAIASGSNKVVNLVYI